MTETNLREILVATARAYMGANTYNGQKQEIIDIYNKNQPRPRGYKVQYSDAWCATFVSAMGYIAGFSRIVFPECSCPEMISKYMFANCWEERDDYVPKPGDIIFYDWNDSGIGDCSGVPDHVGIVESCNGYNITVIEGNKGDTVGRRNLLVNSRYVRGYGVPNYSLIADEKDEPETKLESEETEMVYKTLNDVPKWAYNDIKALIDCDAIEGDGMGNINLNETLMRALIVMKRMADANHKTYGRVVDGKVTDVPDWALDSLQALVDDGTLVGTGSGKLDLSMDMLRTLVIVHKMLGGHAT